MPTFLLHKKLEESAKKYGRKPAMLFKKDDGYVHLTFSQVLEQAQKIGYFLIKEGIKPKENIALFLENQPSWGCIYFGILFSGCVCVPLDAKLNPEELENLFNNASVRIVFTSRSLVDKIDTSKGKLKIILVDEDKEPLSFLKDISIPKDFVWLETSIDDICSLVYTSGTISQPKGVMLTHRSFSANTNSIKKLDFITENDNLISILPLHHIYPFMANLLLPLFLGAKITYVDSLASEEIFKCIKETNVTILSAVPQFFSLLTAGIKTKLRGVPFFMRIFLAFASEGLWLIRKITRLNLAKILFKKVHNNLGGSLRLFLSGGAKLDPKDATGMFKLGFTILEGYGLTETSPVVSFNKADKMKIGSVGRAIPDVEVKINNPDKDGVGEIIIKGENVFKGYYKRDDLTREAIKNDWFHSGDLGYIDKKGFIIITGRCKEVIVLRSGKNIYPDELEEFYRQSPQIKELCALETPKGLQALVVPDMEYFSKTKFSDIQGGLAWELDNFSRKLPSYKRLMGFVISKEDLPRTRLGKLQRYKVKQMYEEKVSAQKKRAEQKPGSFDVETLSNLGFFQKVVAFLTKELKMQVKPDDHLELDLGIDSLRRVELGLSLEKFLGVELGEGVLSEVFTVKELVSKLEELVKDTSVSVDLKTTDQLWKEFLSQQPAADVSKKIQLNPTFFSKLFIFITAAIFYLIFLIFCFFRIKGRNNIPKKGPYIFCTNHTSYLDALIVVSSLPFTIQLQLFFLGHTDIFELPIFRWMVKIARIIPVDPTINLVDAMQASSYVLRNSKIACIFPEGQRTMDGKIGEFKNGVGILIKELDIPCVPVYIKGAYQVWPRYRRIPRPHPIKISFGKSYTAEELKLKGSKNISEPLDDYTLITRGIREVMVELRDQS